MPASRKPSQPLVVEEVGADGTIVECLRDWVFAIRYRNNRKDRQVRFALGQGVLASQYNPDVKKGTLGWITQIRRPHSTPDVSDYCVWVMFERQSLPVAYKLKHIKPR